MELKAKLNRLDADKANLEKQRIAMERNRVEMKESNTKNHVNTISLDEFKFRVKKLTNEKKDLNKQIENRNIEASAIDSKRKELRDFQTKLSHIENSIQQLSEGIEQANEVVLRANEHAFEKIGDIFSRYFSILLPSKRAKLYKTGERVEDGIEFVVWDAASGDRTISEDALSDANSNVTLAQLSGGQKTLLSLSFIFAVATFHRSMFYLLDEVDAALDETNQAIVAKAIKKIFKTKTQIISVSHNHSFQTEAERTIFVEKPQHTIIAKVINKV